MPLVSLDQVADHAFDYIVIGGGTAGLTIASRLSENADWSILVLEAGNAHLDHPLISYPAQYGLQLANPEYDWGFKTAPQKFSNNREYPWNRGKGLGGSSAMNFSVWTLPPREDIDNWEKLGNPDWNWENYERYSTRAVTFAPFESSTISDFPADAFDVWEPDKARGDGEGPLHIAHSHRLLDVDCKMYQTLLNKGFQKSRAPYHGDTRGTYLMLNTVHPNLHHRTYAATSSTMHRPNLFILIGVDATAIVSSDSADESEFEASGVKFRHRITDTLHRAHVRREVILSAGTIKSPQILELSGIGRPEVLSKMGVNVKVPLNGVGENVQDHQFIGCTYQLKDDYAEDTNDILRDNIQREKHAKLFSEGQGIHMSGIVPVTFIPLETVTPEAEGLYAIEEKRIRQDIQQGNYPPGLAEQYEIQLQKGALDCELVCLSGCLSGPNYPRPGKKYYSILGFRNHTFSRGTIHISSSNPNDYPVIDPHYFEHELDLQMLIKEVKYIRELVKTSPLKDLLSDDPSAMELNPGLEVQTDEQIADWIKQTCSTGWHAIGSLSMLPKEKNGVVDSKLKVYGTKNIRVVDLSIAPMHIAAHTQATAYIIAEQAADIIKDTFASLNSVSKGFVA